MKAALVALLVIVGMSLVGWLTIGDSQDGTTITIKKKAIQQDTRKVLDKGQNLLDEAKDKLHKKKDSAMPAESTK